MGQSEGRRWKSAAENKLANRSNWKSNSVASNARPNGGCIPEPAVGKDADLAELILGPQPGRII